MALSSESMPINESDQKGFREFDRMAGIIASMLIQLFGDEDIDQTADAADHSISMNNKRKGANCSNCSANCIEMSSGERSLKKRRYRSIHNLYMATKPINFLEGNKYYG
ncbi:hypothetical protein Salat_1365400 [Sesamum alatum]|uniref:Uncharacterized protein n=1 Tax=Sesamum alatum TaxID=300844 RepID=A0AAE1YID6_9LAMI|nr:hypothetical protein Salat_1365400 [Sesamum alatum]